MSTIDTNNYTIGGVDLYFNASIAHGSLFATPTGGGLAGSAFRHAGNNLGNIVSAEITPDVTYVEHFISVLGKRRKDKVSANTEALTIPFVFDEMNDDNLKKFMMASFLQTDKHAPMQKSLLTGSMSLHFRTDVGQNLFYSAPKVTLRPDGPLGINPEDWWTAPMVMEVLYYEATDHYASKPYGMIDTSP